MSASKLPDRPVEYRLSAWLFLRSLGVVYLIAFASLSSQILGLLGSRGLLPVRDLFGAVGLQLNSLEGFCFFPSIFWFCDADAALVAGAWTGMVVAVLFILNIAPRLCAGGLWFLYLSFVTVGRNFFSFQWDMLLLETGFAAIFLTPAHFWRAGRGEPEPPRLARWLLVWLLFRLNVESGLAKLLSGDMTWRNLTAMDFYYETAPIPTLFGWWAHQLPHGFQAASVVLTFLAELGAPFLLFAPRPWRIGAAVMLAMLQVGIQLTANYTFFNILTVVLCILIVDDDCWNRIAGLRRMRERLSRPSAKPLFRVPMPLQAAGFGLLVLTSILIFTGWFRWFPLGGRLVSLVSPFRSVNAYGLFAVMTQQRWELEILGSQDGGQWRRYPFRYKPGDLLQAPPFVAPHQPRLDFQCWFLTFDGGGAFNQHPYVVSLIRGIAENNPTILRLLGQNPFPEGRPRYLRLRVHRYQMTTPAEKRATGCYWKIIESRDWSPLLKLER